MKLQSLLVVGLILLTVSIAISQERFLMPVDEGTSDATFSVFREKLVTATKAKDAKYIQSVLDPKIVTDFGGGRGIETFLKYWKRLTPQSDFWSEFLSVISNGGTFNTDSKSKQFWAPYAFSSFPDDLDGFEHAAVIGTNVRLRSAPQAESDIVADLSYNLVKVEFEDPASSGGKILGWTKIETLGGKKGYVKAEYVRSPTDYRASFKKKGGFWKMTAFVAGD